MTSLSNHLWESQPNGFLAHGMEGGGFENRQPVLLTVSNGDPANGAQLFISVNGADVDQDEVGRYERVCVVFSGAAEDEKQHARRLWKAFVDSGVPSRYMSQETGKWLEKMSKNCESTL